MKMRLAPLAILGLAACSPAGGAPQKPLPGSPWKGVETRLLEDDLVSFVVGMSGKPSPEGLYAYSRCAAAQYALIRGFGFARHIRTAYFSKGGVQYADAVYTVADALPEGIKTIDAEVTLADCRLRGIPSV